MDSFEEGFTAAFETGTLEGSRVSLVGLCELDAAENFTADGLFNKILDSRDFLSKNLPWVTDTNVADLKKRVRSWVLAERLGQGGCWRIYDRSAGENSLKSLAGFIMMDVNLKNHSATFSYWLFKDFTHRGLMAESVRLLCDYCFNALKLNRLEIFSAIDNERSIAVAERSGFCREGICRDFELKDGVFVDHVRFSRLARDVYQMFT